MARQNSNNTSNLSTIHVDLEARYKSFIEKLELPEDFDTLKRNGTETPFCPLRKKDG